MNSKFRRIACLCLTGVMGVSLAASQIFAFAKNNNTADGQRADKVSFEDVSGKVDLTGVALQNLSPKVLENAGLSESKISKNADYTVIVELSGESVISAAEGGDIPEYLTTYSGRRTLKNIIAEQEAFLHELSLKGIGYTYIDSYTSVANAVAVRVNYSNLEKLNKIKGVKNVVLSSSYDYPKAVDTATDSANVAFNPSNIYATGIYDAGSLNAEGIDGSGMAVAVLDTGLDYTHDAFTSYMPETVRYTKEEIGQLMADKQFTSESLSGGNGVRLTANDVYINEKVPFAYDYADHDTDVYPSYSNHGTHVAGIVAGQADSYYDKDGNIVYEADGVTPVPFRGVAPNAQLVICKVFTDNFDSENLGGAITEDVLAALDDCVNLGVDVINMSLGSASGFSSLCIKNDELGLNDTEGIWISNVYEKVRAAGISLICAASNEYSSGFGSAFGTNLASSPDSGTIGSPSTYSGAMSVASINGQYAPYMTVNTGTDADPVIKPVFYLESSDENSVSYNFLEGMGVTSEAQTFKYVVIPGRGEAADYTTSVQNALKDKQPGEKVIAVIRRGKTTFQEKVVLAMSMQADAVIMCNNVAGTVRMSLGDIDDPIPTVSVNMEAGSLIIGNAKNNIGYITLNPANLAGPFMNDYSSWGVTSDLTLKPDITAHGGEITSTVPGGYGEQSGTSMASPNFAGFAALLRSYLKGKPEFSSYTNIELTNLVNNIAMSSATVVYDQDILPYSPRKQGAGLATLTHAFGTGAYLYTKEGQDNGAESGRPKVELGEDKDKKGEYTVTFYANNFGGKDLTFTLKSIFMTESIASDGLSVAEKAHLFGDEAAKWTVNGVSKNEGDEITVPANAVDFKISVTLKISAAERNYLDKNFKNGMFIEGYAVLEAKTQGQCNLNVPYLGFYGDWKSAPMLDYDCYEIAKFEQDTSLKEEERPKAQVWATQAFAKYYNGQYSVPLGSYMYLQNEYADQMYANEEYNAVSQFDLFNGVNDPTNYCTTTEIKALYAGLLRNAEVVQYKLYDEVTGELLYTDYKYRVGKAISGGGSAIPANVEIELDPVSYGLVSNGKYRLDFSFYFEWEDVGKVEPKEEDTFTMTFYVDYEAPVLEEARVRFYDYKDGNKDRQRVYLDLDIYDNHYPQAVVLCYADINDSSQAELVLATDFVTPVYNPVKNGTTTVSIEITDFYEEYKDSLYIQIDDYALNHSTYLLRLSTSTSDHLPDKFEIAEGTEITIGVNENRKLTLNGAGDANISSFNWESVNETYVKVRNGEIFGVRATTRPIAVTVDNGKGGRSIIHVTVVDKNITLPIPSISFGLIETAGKGLMNAVGAVDVYAGRTFTLAVEPDPWYYDVNKLNLRWRSSDESIARVDQSGNVTTLGEEGSATITAVILNESGSETLYAATVMLNVQDPFRVSNFALTDYNGPGGDVVIPDDKNIMNIGEEAFKDDLSITSIVIPKTVTQISERAFQGCTNLKAVYFISKEAQKVADARLSLILEDAFRGCTSLEILDLSNVKIVTADRGAFRDCTSLKTIKKMSAIGTMNDYAFAGCTSLESVDLTGAHSTLTGVFSGCTSLKTVTTGYYTSIGSNMFGSLLDYSGRTVYEGCKRLTEIVINTPNVAPDAFSGCEALEKVTFGGAITDKTLTFTIGARAFENCIVLSEVEFGNHKLSSVGDQAFHNCLSLVELNLPDGNVVFGDRVFEGTQVTVSFKGGVERDVFGAYYVGTELLLAPKTITADFAIKEGTTSIADFAFSSSSFANGVSVITIPDTVTDIGEGAFAYLPATRINLPANLKSIPNYAFYACLELESITIPANVTSIGSDAFHGCESLSEITFNEKLTSIGYRAFYSCLSLTAVSLPDSVSTLGDRVFENCTHLQSAEIPAVKRMGAYVFTQCPALITVTFGDGTTDIGTYTFFPGMRYTSTDVYINESSLARVILPAGLEEIGEGVFYYCSALTTINLNRVTKVGELAFAYCTALVTEGENGVKGLGNLVEIGENAFLNCTGLTALNLGEAKYIGNQAFANSTGKGGCLSISIPKAEVIGSQAFYGAKFATIELPATLKSIGFAPFAGNDILGTVTVAAGNGTFYTEGGVLFRRIDGKQSELMVYPAAKAGEEYAIPEGTVSVNAYAFTQLNGTLKTVTIPYSVKRIGVGAFIDSGVTTYNFLGVTAPALLTEPYDNSGYEFITNMQTAYTLFYANFDHTFVENSNIVTNPTPSGLTIRYPENGKGYDNYVFKRYFGTKNITAEALEDAGRSFRELMNEILAEYPDPVATVKGWATLPVNEANTATVTAFSDAVKEAHRVYNTVLSPSQRKLIDTDAGKEEGYYYNLLTSIESELKPVKPRFGIAVFSTSLRVNSDSAHKSEYKVGEKFDMTGLKLTVTYDDYSTAEVTAEQMTLRQEYDRELTELDIFVEVAALGQTVQVRVNVTAGNSEPPEHTEHVDEDNDGKCDVCGEDMAPDTGCAGCSSTIIGGDAIIAVMALLAVVAVTVAVKLVNRRKSK